MIIFSTYKDIEKVKDDIFELDYNSKVRYKIVKLPGLFEPEYYWKKIKSTNLESKIRLNIDCSLNRLDKKEYVKEQRKYWALESNKIFK